MGYSTKFRGRIEITPPLNTEEINYLRAFNETRRMHRNLGPYFTDNVVTENALDNHGQTRREDIISYNAPFPGDEHNPAQPGLWCGWTPTEDGTALVWDRMEKFYNSAQWMEYLIEVFLKNGAVVLGDAVSDTEVFAPGWIRPAEFDHFTGHDLNGRIEAQGEEYADRWDLVVTDNEVTKVMYDTDPAGEIKSVSYGYDESPGAWATVVHKSAE